MENPASSTELTPDQPAGAVSVMMQTYYLWERSSSEPPCDRLKAMSEVEWRAPASGHPSRLWSAPNVQPLYTCATCSGLGSALLSTSR